MRCKQARDEDGHAYCKRSAANSEELVEVALNDGCTTTKIFAEGFRQVSRQIRLRLIIRKMNNHPERPVRRQFSGPSHDIFLGFPIEVFLSKRKRIKRMEELCDVIDADFDHILRILRDHRPARSLHGCGVDSPTTPQLTSLVVPASAKTVTRQCENRMGSCGFDNMLLVAPPRMNSRKRECP